ncbi:MAG TPA: hypothetical protein VGT61_02540 [Thermomicrobiales bacterium]|jgi:mannose-6-phosphate isomerase|nr:hypothetical protein [Thermomicrobiales bacterium]
MATSDWYPIRLTTPTRDYAFGERMIVDRLHKRGLPTSGRIAETWEVSGYHGAMGVVTNGRHRGRTLQDLTEAFPDELVGQGWRGERFPLLAKFLDATHMLPVHLHAGDAVARDQFGEPNGKTEAWHILDCADDATVLVGVRPELSRDDIEQALREERWGDVLHRYPIAPGETIYVPGGTLHTFGPDAVVFEIQQTSDLGVTAMKEDIFGQPKPAEEREADLAELMRDIDLAPQPRPVHGLTRYEGDVRIVAGCAGPHFALERWNLAVPYDVPARPDRCLTLTNLGEPVAITWDGGVELLDTAESCVIPAAMPGFTLVPDGKAVVLACFVPSFPRDIVEPLRAAGYGDDQIATLGDVPFN